MYQTQSLGHCIKQQTTQQGDTSQQKQKIPIKGELRGQQKRLGEWVVVPGYCPMVASSKHALLVLGNLLKYCDLPLLNP